jgi:hypothetical protein
MENPVFGKRGEAWPKMLHIEQIPAYRKIPGAPKNRSGTFCDASNVMISI